MKHFPMALYICPGVERLESGLFTTRLVHDEAERDTALADGWHTCQEDAKEAHEAAEAEVLAAKIAAEKAAAEPPAPAPTPAPIPAPEPAPEPAPVPAPSETPADAEDAAAKRAAMEAKATELGIPWNYRWGDKKLADVIAATQEA